MDRKLLCANVVLAFGVLLTAGCFSNGAVEFDSKCDAFESASVSKNYFIEQIELRGMADLFSKDKACASSNDMASVSNSLGKAFAAALEGVSSRPVSSSEEVEDKNRMRLVGGFGRDKKRGLGVANWLSHDGPFASNFTTTRNADAELISISIGVSKTNANGAIATVNNFLALCTLNIWPWYHSASLDYYVEVKSAAGVKRETFNLQEQSLTSWTPLALCPVPARADYRASLANPLEEGAEAKQVGQCVISLLGEKSIDTTKYMLE